MKRFMVIGRINSGKTTLCRCLAELPQMEKKTQTAEVVGQCIDTPGEYLEHRGFYRALSVMSMDVDVVLLLQSCTDSRLSFAPGLSNMFAPPIFGVVTKIDEAPSREAVEYICEQLRQAGAEYVFYVSSVSGEGIQGLKDALI